MFLVISLFLTVMLGSKNIDVLGHLGGFITGAIVGLWVMPCLESTPAKIERASTFGKYSKIGTVVFFTAMLVAFFTLREPANKMGASIAVSDPKVSEEIAAALEGSSKKLDDKKDDKTLVQTEAEAEAEVADPFDIYGIKW